MKIIGEILNENNRKEVSGIHNNSTSYYDFTQVVKTGD